MPKTGLIRVILAAGLALGWAAAPSPAQTTPKPSAPAESPEAADFRDFIVQHPQALAELKKDPSLIAKPAFSQDHLVVGEYIAAHPKVKEIVKANPDFFANLTAATPGGQHGKKKRNGEKKQ